MFGFKSIGNYKLFLAISFGLLIILMAISGGSIVFLASEIQSDIRLIQDNYTQTVRLIGLVETDVNQQRILVRDLVFMTDSSQRNTARMQIDSVMENIISLLAQTQRIVILPEELGNFQTYITAIDQYFDAIREVIDSANAGNQDIANQLLRTKMVPYRNRLKAISLRLVESNINAEQTTRRHINDLESRFLITGVLILVLSLGLSLFIYRFVLVSFRRYIQSIISAEREQKRLLELLTERQKKIEKLMVSVSSVEEDQRKRISQELHDSIGHGLTIAKFHVDSARSTITMPPPDAGDHLDQALGAIRSTLAESRRIAYELRPTLLDDLGLKVAVTQMVTEFERRTGVTVRPELLLDGERPKPIVEITLYRIIQEALTNIERHAEAKTVFIQMIRRDNGTIALSITDDGKGFNVTEVAWNLDNHFGLRNILERGELLGGTVLIESRPGKGTEINVEIPAQLSGASA